MGLVKQLFCPLFPPPAPTVKHIPPFLIRQTEKANSHQKLGYDSLGPLLRSLPYKLKHAYEWREEEKKKLHHYLIPRKVIAARSVMN